MATSERTLLDSETTRAILSKPAQTLLFVVILALVPLAIPSLQKRLSVHGESYREFLPRAAEFVAFKSKSAPANPLQSAENVGSETAETKPAQNDCVDQLIVDPENVMDAFNEALSRSDAKKPGAITRVTHYGDSPITNDGITGTARQLLQKRFGDSGHGFILIDRPWDWYGHQAITFDPSGNWTSSSLMNPITRDGLFGLGGVSFSANGPGRSVRFAPASSGETGKKFSHLEVYYLEQPEGGQFSVTVNDTDSKTVSTAGAFTKSGFFKITAPDPFAKSFSVTSVSGQVRVFGAVLENDDPGVVYDSLGVNGAFAGLLATAMNEQHWTEQLQHRGSDLVILNYGTNESQDASDDQMARYDRELREVVRRVRTALPKASILIVSPMDRGKRAGAGRVITLPAIPKIVELQRRVAAETHCAFLNLFAAMGGEGTMARWSQGSNRLVRSDLTHPTVEGSQTVGTLIYTALMENYNNYRERLEKRSRLSSKKE
jgi:lysophospholipase L1-like esterase